MVLPLCVCALQGPISSGFHICFLYSSNAAPSTWLAPLMVYSSPTSHILLGLFVPLCIYTFFSARSSSLRYVWDLFASGCTHSGLPRRGSDNKKFDCGWSNSRGPRCGGGKVAGAAKCSVDDSVCFYSSSEWCGCPPTSPKPSRW